MQETILWITKIVKTPSVCETCRNRHRFGSLIPADLRQSPCWVLVVRQSNLKLVSRHAHTSNESGCISTWYNCQTYMCNLLVHCLHHYDVNSVLHEHFLIFYLTEMKAKSFQSFSNGPKTRVYRTETLQTAWDPHLHVVWFCDAKSIQNPQNFRSPSMAKNSGFSEISESLAKGVAYWFWQLRLSN